MAARPARGRRRVLQDPRHVIQAFELDAAWCHGNKSGAGVDCASRAAHRLQRSPRSRCGPRDRPARRASGATSARTAAGMRTRACCADLAHESPGVEPVGGGGFGDRLESRHRAADARHTPPSDHAARGGPAGEQFGHGGVAGGRVHPAVRHGEPMVARHPRRVVALAQGRSRRGFRRGAPRRCGRGGAAGG